MLNKQSGNMYGFVTHTWNAIKGQCEHDCEYCYMKKFKLNPVRFDEKELKCNLGEGNFIFVGSGNDMFSKDIPADWISQTIDHCFEYNKNKYLFQSKNPIRMSYYAMPGTTIFATTIESNRDYPISKAPLIKERIEGIKSILGYDKMITIEPILRFDLDELVGMIKSVEPIQVNVGADSKGHHLPEPSTEEINRLIEALKPLTKVFLKDNLKRLAPSFA